MNETDARDALLLRSYETAAELREGVWSDTDRAWASRAALEVEGESASVDGFIARRARLGVERLAQRDRAAARVRTLLTWRPWLGRVLPPLAFVAGVASDAIGSSQRISLLAPPLLLLIAWNIAIYLIAAIGVVARPGAGQRTQTGPVVTLLARLARGALGSIRVARLTGPARQFALQWLEAGAPLARARIVAILHGCAALLAAGMLAGLYTRGLVLEYRAHWESTFLDAGSVHTILSLLLAPASMLTGIALPDAVSLERLYQPAGPGGDAAPWIHLYAVTVALLVIAPRTLMALWARWRARGLTRRFPLALDDPYFAALGRAHGGAAARVLVLPYGYHPRPASRNGLARLLRDALGPQTRAEMAEPVDYGQEQHALADGLDPWEPATVADAAAAVHPAARIVLLNMSTTPEAETHGAFLRALNAASTDEAPMLVVIDESTFRERFDGTGPSGSARISQRHEAWRRLLSDCALDPVFIDLQHATPGSASRLIADAIAGVSRGVF